MKMVEVLSLSTDLRGESEGIPSVRLPISRCNMLKRWFPVVNAGALVLLLASASTSHAQLGSFLGRGISPWSGTGGFMYAPNGMGFNYYRPGMYSGYGGYGGYGMGMMGMGWGLFLDTATEAMAVTVWEWLPTPATVCLPRSP